MRKLIMLLLACNATALYAQKTNGTILTPSETETAIPENRRAELGINFPIYRVYNYTDKTGEYYFVLTESRDEIGSTDTTSYKIKAFNFRKTGDSLKQTWSLNDQIRKEAPPEGAIWFMTRWCEVRDIDNDGITDIILPYCTVAMNGVDDGRVKIFVIYKGQKIGIRHQNGVLDDERETNVDKVFYDLPASIQTTVTNLMETLVAKNKAIFPYKWQEAMKKKKTVFNERN